mgnify:CR=1 FL=1
MTHLSKLLAGAGIPEDLKRQIREAAGKDVAGVRNTIDYFIQMDAGEVWTEYHWRAALQANKEIEELCAAGEPISKD